MTPVYKTTDDLLSDYNSLPEIEQNRVGKYLKNLVRIHKAIASLNFADRQVNWELSKQRIEPYTEAEEIKCSFCGKSSNEVEKMIVASDDVCMASPPLHLLPMTPPLSPLTRPLQSIILSRLLGWRTMKRYLARSTALPLLFQM